MRRAVGIVAVTIRRFSFKSAVCDAMVCEEVLDGMFHGGVFLNVVNDEMGCQGHFRSRQRPDVQVMHGLYALLAFEQGEDGRTVNVVGDTIESQAERLREKVPSREKDDDGNQNANDGVDDAPACLSNDDATDKDTNTYQCIGGHVQISATNIEVVLALAEQQPSG